MGSNPLSLRRVLQTWQPLAISWLMLCAELPLVSAVVARMGEAEINLAAWGIVFALAIIIQAPSTMLLAASTALSSDWESYRRMRRFMFGVVAVLTTLHVLVAFTPLYDFVMQTLIDVPPELIEPARIGLMIMTPWSMGTAYRRFQQGVLIRFGHAREIVLGTVIRMSVDGLVLAIGLLSGTSAGVVVATLAIILGVVSEAIYADLRVRPVLRQELPAAAPGSSPLSYPAILSFYVPLALTMLLSLLVQPMVSAALSRMPNPLASLAIWPALFGVLNMWQAGGIAYNEVVIALLDEQQAVLALRRFTFLLVAAMTLLLLLVAVTPLGRLWFEHVAGLEPELARLAQQALWISLLLPGLRALQSWYQGIIVYGRRTQAVTEAVVLFMVSAGIILAAGVARGTVAGLYVGVAALAGAFLVQTGWLWRRSRRIVHVVRARDEVGTPAPL